jgi:hypothetical protein
MNSKKSKSPNPRTKRAKPGQVREWKYKHDSEYNFDPTVDVFLVVKECEIVHGVNSRIEGVVVMYPDGFMTEHYKRDLEYDSIVIV